VFVGTAPTAVARPSIAPERTVEPLGGRDVGESLRSGVAALGLA
jgi:hypothetical protein